MRLFFLKFVVAKSKNEMPNSKYGIAGIVFLSIKFTIDTIKEHIEASKNIYTLVYLFPPQSNSDCCLHYTSSISLRTVGCCDESERDCLPVRQFILLYFLHDKFTDLISLQSCLVHIY